MEVNIETNKLFKPSLTPRHLKITLTIINHNISTLITILHTTSQHESTCF